MSNLVIKQMIFKILGIYLLLLNVDSNNAARLAMKVVESPVAYGVNNDLISPMNTQEGLVLQVQPQIFSGPEQLLQLVGRCYNFTDELYRYVLCPFQNVTQHETSSRWNAYQGVLGVWEEWKIVNKSFHAMVMTHGDFCGTLQRSTEVFMECGDTEMIKDVSEPSKCHYRMVFLTQLVCHPDAMLVYPRLSSVLQKKWDQLETEFVNEDITEKGYSEGLRQIFLEAKFFATKPMISTTSSLAVSNKTDNTENHLRCLQEVADLRKEIEALRVLIELNSITEKKGI